jgi:hypothetical protein
LVSKRSLRPDPNFDALIAKLYPNGEDDSLQTEASIALRNHQRSLLEDRGSMSLSQSPEDLPTERESFSLTEQTEIMETEREVELILKPLVSSVGVPTCRYLKTTDMASIAHVSKYLMVREALETPATDTEVNVQLAEDETGWLYKISIVNPGGDTVVSLCCGRCCVVSFH